jgi:hypothetical protein
MGVSLDGYAACGKRGGATGDSSDESNDQRWLTSCGSSQALLYVFPELADLCG